MKPRIIEECRKKMRDAIWLELERNPDGAQGARADIVTPSGSISIWCHPEGNTALVTHNRGNNDSERLEEAIEGCVDYREVAAEYYRENPEDRGGDPMDTYNDMRLDLLMERMG